jgi:hypothetical protein
MYNMRLNARFEAQERPAMHEPESDDLSVAPVSILKLSISVVSISKSS